MDHTSSIFRRLTASRTRTVLLTAFCVACARSPGTPETRTGSSPTETLPTTSDGGHLSQVEEDGSELWLRYREITAARVRERYRSQLERVVIAGNSPTFSVISEEIEQGLSGLLGTVPPEGSRLEPGALVVATAASPLLSGHSLRQELRGIEDGYLIRRVALPGGAAWVVAAGTDVGALYGTFAFLRHLLEERPLEGLSVRSVPRLKHRLLNHWDNLDGSIVRGYAGDSIFEWDELPNTISPRYRDYARANASIGINGSVLTSVNADARVLSTAYLQKVAAIADVLRPYGVKSYLTARFSAPVELGGLPTADPLDERVRAWWADKIAEIYSLVPDFGGFLVKANSEGEPGPQDYGRTHAEGANVLAQAVGSHGGIVMWRAFVYKNEVPVDRIMQAYDEFVPLDGQFHPAVAVQVKNGPLDFQPREPFHPLFGAMPKTPLFLELQITKEYLGQDTHMVYLGPYFEEVLDADTFSRGRGSTVAQVIRGGGAGDVPRSGQVGQADSKRPELDQKWREGGIAGVANVGDDRNWCGSHMNQANWYVFGRLAWDPKLSSRAIADEWVRATFGNDPDVIETVTGMLMDSREAVVNYMTPLGLVHIMAAGHHYGPGPWVDDLGRADWNSVYYHRADATGLGFDRTKTGSNALSQYADEVAKRWASRDTVPDELLLFFHHVPWSETMRSGKTLWQELIHRYDEGVKAVGSLRGRWNSLEGKIDPLRHREVADFLRIQHAEARWWKDAVLSYFATFSSMPLPSGQDAPAHDLEFYRALECPADPTKPRCPPIYE